MSRFSNPRGIISPGGSQQSGAVPGQAAAALRQQQSAQSNRFSGQQQQMAMQQDQFGLQQSQFQTQREQIKHQLAMQREQIAQNDRRLSIDQDRQRANAKYKQQEVDTIRARNAQIKEMEKERLALQQKAADIAAAEAKRAAEQHKDLHPLRVAATEYQTDMAKEQLLAQRIARQQTALAGVTRAMQSLKSYRPETVARLTARLSEPVLKQFHRVQGLVKEVASHVQSFDVSDYKERFEAAGEEIPDDLQPNIYREHNQELANRTEEIYQESIRENANFVPGGGIDQNIAEHLRSQASKIARRELREKYWDEERIDYHKVGKTLSSYIDNEIWGSLMEAVRTDQPLNEVDTTLLDRTQAHDLVGAALTLRKILNEGDVDGKPRQILTQAYNKLKGVKNRQGIPIVDRALLMGEGREPGIVNAAIQKQVLSVLDGLDLSTQKRMATILQLAQAHMDNPEKAEGLLDRATEMIPDAEKEKTEALNSIKQMVKTGQIVGEDGNPIEAITLYGILKTPPVSDKGNGKDKGKVAEEVDDGAVNTGVGDVVEAENEETK